MFHKVPKQTINIHHFLITYQNFIQIIRTDLKKIHVLYFEFICTLKFCSFNKMGVEKMF